MAISVVDLVMSMRYALGDMQGLNISDYELIEPINQAAHKLYSYLSERHVREAAAEQEIKVETDGQDNIFLEDTFVRICQVLGKPLDTDEKKYGDDAYRVIIPTTNRRYVFGAYKLIGRKFRAAAGNYIVEYYFIPAKVNSLGENLNVPESMRSWIEQLALAYYKKDYVTATGLAQQCEAVLAGREVPNFENTGAAQTLGARAAQG